MVFRWDWLTNIEYRSMDHTVGLKTPTIAGGLFSIGKFIEDLIPGHNDDH